MFAASFAWQCAVVDAIAGDSPCATSVLDTLSAATAGTATIAAGSLALGTRARFSVTATNGTRSATASQLVDIVAGSPPAVSIVGPGRLNPTDQLVLYGAARSTSGAGECAGATLTSAAQGGGSGCTAAFSWSVSPAAWSDAAGSAATLETARASRLGYSELILLPGSLPGGSSFTIELTAFGHAAGSSGTAQLLVSPNLPPYGGAVTAHPANSTLGDPVTISAAGFVDEPDDLPLSYTFSVRNDASGAPRPEPCSRPWPRPWPGSSRGLGQAPPEGHAPDHIRVPPSRFAPPLTALYPRPLPDSKTRVANPCSRAWR